MDYIEQMFNKYSKIQTLRSNKVTKVKRTMTIEDFRYAVEDIEVERSKSDE